MDELDTGNNWEGSSRPHDRAEVKRRFSSNVGSTIKLQLVDTDKAAIASAADRRLARGQIERIGSEAVVENVGRTFRW